MFGFFWLSWCSTFCRTVLLIHVLFLWSLSSHFLKPNLRGKTSANDTFFQLILIFFLPPALHFILSKWDFYAEESLINLSNFTEFETWWNSPKKIILLSLTPLFSTSLWTWKEDMVNQRRRSGGSQERIHRVP